MKEHNTLSRGEELLKEALEECLEEDLSFVPPEREIMRQHPFSEAFQERMQELLADCSREHKEREIRKHFLPRYGQWAACVLIFCVCGGLLYSLVKPLTKQMDSRKEAALEDTLEEAAAEEESALAEGFAVPESAFGSEDGAKEPDGSQVKYWNGQEVSLAERQEVPEFLDYVTTLVNCPVQDEKNQALYLTIGNTGEESLTYLTRYDLEVWLSGSWYRIPHVSGESGEWLELEGGMAVDEEIGLDEYELDYGAQRYRLIAYVNEDIISAEFTFEEVFSQQMEQLEEEDSKE